MRSIGGTTAVHTTQLGDFLRARRESLTPREVGLVAGGRRRTPGLRREEVALLAGVSVDYYERLERSRATNPSTSLLANLARALRLNADEREYLYRLAGVPVGEVPPADGYVEPGMMFLLDRLDTVPAHVLDSLNTVVAQNALSVALFGKCAGEPGYTANLAWRWFTDPRTRAYTLAGDHEAIGRGWTAELRAAVAHRGNDRVATTLVDDLLAASEEFARYWASMEVARFKTVLQTYVHPAAGHLRVNCDMVLSSPNGHRLLMLRPEPGTGTAERLEFLAAVGATAVDL